MDTPERNQIGTPLSKIEESPFSNFANSLSPINASKPTHISQTFSSISFTSPPSVFTSPQVSLQKDSRFLRRHQLSDLAKPQLSSGEENRSFKDEQLLSADEQRQELTNDEIRSEKPASNEASVGPLCDVSKGATEMPGVLEYDRTPTTTTATASGIDGKCELDMFTLDSYVEGRPAASFGPELNSDDMDQHNDEEPCDWQSLISGSTDLVVLDSPNGAAVLKGSFQNSVPERNVFVSLLSRFPPSLANGPFDSNDVNLVMYNESSGIDQSAQSTEIDVLKKIYQVAEERAVVSMNDYTSGNSTEKSGNKSFYNVHRGLRRRCLDFEMPRAKIIDSVLHSSSSLSLFEEKSSDSKLPITPQRDSSRCVLPNIGLHLNALAGVANQEMSSPRSQEALLNSTASVPSEKDVGPAENELQIMEDPPLASSPKKKRCKIENNAEAESCKRCNCKKSKCLKLYCECFAAGVYCVEPCSCQDCFNKPIHEETVLATRKQIESRNPLAFAPKVIRTLDSTQEVGEDSTRTPASARHKRGCNCKKSNCLKKYCECYQGGVGCSVGCRCEGCKNAFGRKEGMTLLGMEADIEEYALEKHIMDKDSLPASYHNDDEQNCELTLPKTPLRLLRPSVPLPTSSKSKPPRSSTAKMISSSYLNPIDGPGRSTFLRSQPKVDKCQVSLGEELPTVLQNTSPPSSMKTSSPNSKRVSSPHGNGPSPAMRSSRKLILQSIPSFPSLTPRH